MKTTTTKKEVFSENLEGQHPFYQPFGNFTWKVGAEVFHIGCARGYNAGVIGTEHNGIFMLDKSASSVVFDQYMKQDGCWMDSMEYEAEVMEEMKRIISLSAKELSDFLDSVPRLRENPLKAKVLENEIRKFDLRVRKKYPDSKFSAGEFTTSREKSLTVAATERFILARIHGGAKHAASRFPRRLYDLLSLKYGHIAHYNAEGFFGAQLRDRGDFLSNLELMARERSLHWGRTQADPDLAAAIADVAKTYLEEADILVE